MTTAVTDKDGIIIDIWNRLGELEQALARAEADRVRLRKGIDRIRQGCVGTVIAEQLHELTRAT